MTTLLTMSVASMLAISVATPAVTDDARWQRSFEPLWAMTRTPHRQAAATVPVNGVPKLGDLHDTVMASVARSGHDRAAEAVVRKRFGTLIARAQHFAPTCASGLCEILFVSKPLRQRGIDRLATDFNASLRLAASNLQGREAIGNSIGGKIDHALYNQAYIDFQ